MAAAATSTRSVCAPSRLARGAAQAASSGAWQLPPMRRSSRSQLRRGSKRGRGSKLAAAPARGGGEGLPRRTHHDRLALLDLVAGGLEPGHNLALCASEHKIGGSSGVQAGRRRSTLSSGSPQTRLAAPRKSKPARVPRPAAARGRTGHRARQRGHEDLLDRVLNDQLAPGAAHGALAGRQAPLHGAGRQRRHGAMCKWIRQTDWRPMACGRPASGRCPARSQDEQLACTARRAAHSAHERHRRARHGPTNRWQRGGPAWCSQGRQAQAGLGRAGGEQLSALNVH